MSMPSSPPGWYSDPTGAHQLRYFDGTWTDHVSDNGVQSVSPLASAQQSAAGSAPAAVAGSGASPAGAGSAPRGGKAKWIVGGLALLAAAAVVIALVSRSSDDDNTAGGSSGSARGVDSGQSFCDDFNGTWGIVLGGMITAETTMNSLDLNPAFSGGTTDELNSVTQAAQDAGVIAGEAPDDLKDQMSAVASFLQFAVQLEQGDTSVVGDMQSLSISSEDAAYLLGTVPVSKCTTP